MCIWQLFDWRYQYEVQRDPNENEGGHHQAERPRKMTEMEDCRILSLVQENTLNNMETIQE